MAYVAGTNCCGVCHLICKNYDTIKKLRNELSQYREFSFMAITTESEKILEKRLKSIGFIHVHTVPSRTKPKLLKVWFYTPKSFKGE